MKHYISDFLNYYLLYLLVIAIASMAWFLVYGITVDNPWEVFHNFCASRNYAFIKSLFGGGILVSFINCTFYPMKR